MIRLNGEQNDAVNHEGNAVITACPGSGKTRVLTARVIRALGELGSRRERVIALTFTNRAANEIQIRLDQENLPSDCLWAGTIHSFALEWILRPYAPYCESLRNGFSVASEFYIQQLLQGLIADAKLPGHTIINTSIPRSGANPNTDSRVRTIYRLYKQKLREDRLIDFDDVLYLAYIILVQNPEISATLASIIRVICVDEVQDIQDLQYAILSTISHAASVPICLFFVGDENQSIYEDLGALTKTPEEIAAEFHLGDIAHLRLQGNYRSTQRIIDFYRSFRSNVPPIESLAEYATEPGIITFEDQTIPKEKLAKAIASRITRAISEGAPSSEICVIAPQWWHVRAIARRLVNELPDIEFDAPGLSPLHSSSENLWFKVGRLVLTRPSPKRIRTRIRWAGEALADLSAIAQMNLPENIATPRRLLRLLNGLSSKETDGLDYLRDVFGQFLRNIKLDCASCAALQEAYEGFFNKAEDHLAANEDNIASDVDSFRRLFSHPSGVVVSTCHGVKGEEYDTVIAFGLLQGYIPNWSAIFCSEEVATERESKLLYVICSRAKRRLHLIAEHGRETRSGTPYETSHLLTDATFRYDERSRTSL